MALRQIRDGVREISIGDTIDGLALIWGRRYDWRG
jgi:hypothetical protein